MSLRLLTNPVSGAKQLDIKVSSIEIDGKNLANDIKLTFSGKEITGPNVIGDQGAIVGSFLWDGTTILGTPTSIKAYQIVSGAGVKNVYLVNSANTVYYQFLGLANPDSEITLSKVLDLPASATPLFVKVTNDDNGKITIAGLNIFF